MEEFNKKTLIEALSSLRDHDPPDSLWTYIDRELELGEEEIYPPSAIHELPEHEPPEKVWGAILGELEGESSAKVVKMNWWKPLAVAASLTLLVVAYFLLKPSTLKDNSLELIAVNYSTEEVDNLLIKKDWKEDKESFELYLELCSAKRYICEHPEFQVLQREFTELSEAIEEIEMSMGDYNTDANLITQIKEIELERTDIFKKMMVMLI